MTKLNRSALEDDDISLWFSQTRPKVTEKSGLENKEKEKKVSRFSFTD